VNESHLDSIVLWMVSGMTDHALATACVGKLGLAPEAVKPAIDEARRRITLTADYRRDEMIGTALTRLNDLYGRCLRLALPVADGRDGRPNATDGGGSVITRTFQLERPPAAGNMEGLQCEGSAR
jgi:hypothetical protein